MNKNPNSPWRKSYQRDHAEQRLAEHLKKSTLVRFCQHCGCLGELDPKFNGCCPDGKNDYFPKDEAERRRKGWEENMDHLMEKARS